MTSQRAQRLHTWVVHLAVASLLLAQLLGFLHRATHPSVAWKAFASAEASASQAPPHIAALFAGHALDTDCRLFDQLAHADLASLPVLDLPCDFGEASRLAAVPCGHQPAPERSYCARDPPALA
jgi:hypothetical protein